MRRRTSMLAALAVAISLGCFPLFAQRGGGGHAGGPGGGPAGAPGAGMGAGMGSSMGRGMGESRGGPDMNRGGTTMGNENRDMHQGTSMGPKSSTDILAQNTKLSSQLSGLLPAGTDVQQAAEGFKNLGQFVAAVHVAHNLGIPFDELKAKMTGPNSEKLGKAIKSLKPEADAKAEAKKAKRQAKQDIRQAKENS
jgi:hypothetical protein